MYMCEYVCDTTRDLGTASIGESVNLRRFRMAEESKNKDEKHIEDETWVCSDAGNYHIVNEESYFVPHTSWAYGKLVEKADKPAGANCWGTVMIRDRRTNLVIELNNVYCVRDSPNCIISTTPFIKKGYKKSITRSSWRFVSGNTTFLLATQQNGRYVCDIEVLRMQHPIHPSDKAMLRARRENRRDGQDRSGVQSEASHT